MVLPNYIIDEEKLIKDSIEICRELGIEVIFMEEPEIEDFDTKIAKIICKLFIILTILIF
jgi:hypothetical protein